MADDCDLIEVIHSGPSEVPVGDRKARRLDDMRLDIQARAQAENRSGVLWNVRLEKSYAHGVCGHPFGPHFWGKVAVGKGFARDRRRSAKAGLRSHSRVPIEPF